MCVDVSVSELTDQHQDGDVGGGRRTGGAAG